MIYLWMKCMRVKYMGMKYMWIWNIITQIWLMPFVFMWVESIYDAIKRGLMMRVREKRKKAREKVVTIVQRRWMLSIDWSHKNFD